MAFGRKKKDEGAEDAPKKGLFGRHRNGDADEVSEESEEVVSAGNRDRGNKKKRKARNEMLSSVLRETVTSNVLPDMKANEAFYTDRDGQKIYVGWLLDVADIGGLSKKTSRDEDKGGIVECINKGSMKVLLTSHLMMDEMICFVPDATTLDLMQEFSILADAPYKTFFVYAPDGKKMDLDGAVDVSLSDGFRVLKGEITMNDLLAARGCWWVAGVVDDRTTMFGDDDMLIEDDEDELVDDMPTTIIPPVSLEPQQPSRVEPGDFNTKESVPISMDDIPEIDYDAIDVDEPAANMVQMQQRAQQTSFERPAVPEQPVAQPQPEPALVQEVEVDSMAYRQAVRRKWYSTDLGLEVDLSAFDEAFDTPPLFAAFDENRPTDDGSWMSEYLNQMSRAANADIAALHAQHVSQLRERYLRLMGSYIAAINDKLAMNAAMEDGEPKEGTYAQGYAFLHRKHREQLQEIEAQAHSRRQEMDAEYERVREGKAQAAAARARQDYDQRFSAQLEQKKANIEVRLRSEYDSEFNEQTRRLNDRRRDEAAHRMDYGVTSVLAEIAAQAQEMVEVERARYNEHRATIAEWIEENRRTDIDYVNAAMEEHRQQEKADAVMREMSDRMRQQQMDFEQRKANLEADLADMRSRNDADIRDLKAKHELAMEEARFEAQRLRERESELLDRYKNLDQEKSMEYDKRLKELEDQLAAEKLRYDGLLDQGKRTNVIWIGLAIAAAAAVGCIGFVLGMNQSIDYSMAHAQTSAILAIDWSMYSDMWL